MSGRVPFFLTGGNAKILLNNKTMAFATDVSYKVSVKHASPRVLGRYEVEAHIPLSYEVTGSMTIIRYARGLKEYLGNGSPTDASNKGNGMGSMKLGSALGAVGSALGLPTVEGQFDGAADEALIPQRFFQSKMFNIEIRQKIPNNLGGNLTTGISDTLLSVSDLVVPNPTNPKNDETTIVLLRDCRIEDFQFELTKRGAAIQRITFRARYADDDTFIARKSGVGQELS